ncbi:MAG: hypothetical protein NC218_10490 [Acetobacter sp.]|nr:hypothetical protein [Acetobacter sp.]
MTKKIISLIERNAADELKAYLDSTTLERPLDCHEELVLLEHFLPEAVKSYINRFRFSEGAEVAFLQKAPREMRQMYINYYGLSEAAQKFIIDKDLKEVAQDFMKLRRFWDDGYVLDKASVSILRPYTAMNVLEGDELVLKLLKHSNSTLFQGYVSKGRYISKEVLRAVISLRKEAAFKALMYRFYNRFKQKARTAVDFDQLMEAVAEFALPAELQVAVLLMFNRGFLEILLKTSPLAPEAQDLLFRHNVDAQWLKLHAATLYGVGGYRFTPENEQRLFKVLASKNLDDCLTTFRQRDDVSFVRLASVEAVCKYIKGFWLSDEAQIALLQRGNAHLAKELISRYSPEHGLCWQAEVVLAKNFSEEVVRTYLSFHSICFDAQDVLRERMGEGVMAYYFSLHPY